MLAVDSLHPTKLARLVDGAWLAYFPWGPAIRVETFEVVAAWERRNQVEIKTPDQLALALARGKRRLYVERMAR